MEDNNHIEEPQIEEVKPKRVKLSKLMYKIEPTLPYFPDERLKKIRELYNQLSIEEANAEADGLDISDESNAAFMRIRHWKAKAYFFIGDYKTCQELCNAEVDKLLEVHPYLKVEVEDCENFESLSSQINAPNVVEINDSSENEGVTYIYLKWRLLQARVNKSIGMCTVANQICNQIIAFVKRLEG